MNQAFDISSFFTVTDFFALKPAILLCLFGCGILIMDFMMWLIAKLLRLVGFKSEESEESVVRRGRRDAVTALIGELFVGFAVWQHYADLEGNNIAERTALNGALVVDGFSVFFNAIFVGSTILAIIISAKYLEQEGEHRGEYYALMLFAQAGMSILAAGHELVTLFVGLELMSLSFFVLVGFLRSDKRSNEAAIKYLLLGAFSSGLLAYGFSLFYGMSGSTLLRDVAAAVAGRDAGDPMLLLAMITTSVGLLFKISAVPFHMWAPDVYEGAPTPITAYVSVASKAASFALLIRIFLVPLADARDLWIPMLAAVALVTMTLGNIAAITQENMKRLLAYSSISHAGYILLGLVAANETGLKGISVYLLVYMFMNFGAFALLVMMRREGQAAEDVEDFSGLIHTHPGYAILMLIFLLSLAGIPPTAGFYGKYFIFLALIETDHYVLAVFAALYVAVAAYYYFRIVRVMFLSRDVEPASVAPGWGARVALVASGVFTLWIGLYPEPFIRLAADSILPALR